MRPRREVATNNMQTYFVTSNSAERKPFFRHERWARLFIETLYKYRPDHYRLHGFVLMPDHFHVLLTPHGGLELAVQCIKGGFSYRAKREFAWNGDIWATSFSDHRIRDIEDFDLHLDYLGNNPVKAGLVSRPEEYSYTSANARFELDAFVPGLKPQSSLAAQVGVPKATPFQNMNHPAGNSGK